MDVPVCFVNEIPDYDGKNLLIYLIKKSAMTSWGPIYLCRDGIAFNEYGIGNRHVLTKKARPRHADDYEEWYVIIPSHGVEERLFRFATRYYGVRKNVAIEQFDSLLNRKEYPEDIADSVEFSASAFVVPVMSDEGIVDIFNKSLFCDECGVNIEQGVLVNVRVARKYYAAVSGDEITIAIGGEGELVREDPPQVLVFSCPGCNADVSKEFANLRMRFDLGD